MITFLVIKSSNVACEKEEEKLADLLQALMRGSAHFFLRNTMAKDIITMNFYELKVQFSVILSILRYLMALNEHLDVSLITEKCCDEICSVLKILCDYTMWMICRGTYIICIHKGTLGMYLVGIYSACMHTCTNI